MYTEMQGQYLDEAYVQKCRLMWWTLYVLERHMSTLLGVPMFINDENICTPFPVRPDQGQRTSVMHIQVKLAQILGQIHRSRSLPPYVNVPPALIIHRCLRH